MLNFQKPRIEDRDRLNRLLSHSCFLGSEYCFGNMIIWNSYYETFIAVYKDFGVIRALRGDKAVYSFPFGHGDIGEMLSEIVRDAEKAGKNLEFFGITEQTMPLLTKNLDMNFDFILQPPGFDYIYNSDDLINLSGRKYHGKRNHISAFMRDNKDWSYEDITPENMNDCLEMSETWYLENDRETFKEEKKALGIAFDGFECIGLSGGLLRVSDKVAAFTIGEPLTENAFVIHFEKALNIRGAYPVINREFAEKRLSGYRYINREEDLGQEGLKRAKQSYHPEILLKKYRAIPKQTK